MRNLLPKVGEYFIALAGNWFSIISGGLGVPATFAGVYFDPPVLKIAFGVTAIVCFFVAAFAVWLEQDNRMRALDVRHPVRISLIDLAHVAEHEFGWNFSSGWEALDLSTGLGHAGSDGMLTLEGKKITWSYVPDRPETRARFFYEPIPREMWAAEQLELYITALPEFGGATNFDIYIAGPADKTPRFYDIHVSDVAAARQWLKESGPKFRGQHERWHDEDEARRSARGEE